MDATGGHHGKWNKSDTERQILSSMWKLKFKNPKKPEKQKQKERNPCMCLYCHKYSFPIFSYVFAKQMVKNDILL